MVALCVGSNSAAGSGYLGASVSNVALDIDVCRAVAVPGDPNAIAIRLGGQTYEAPPR